MTKVNVELGTVQETLLIPLWARAAEMRRASENGTEPILHDPRAVEIVSGIDYPFERFERETKLTSVIACILATIFDRWVRRFLEEYPDGAIVEIGAGLDTRFERLDNGRARWFELDLPDSMGMRRRFFEETERRQFLAGSVLDRFWLEPVRAARAPAYLFLAEAVLVYFEEADVQRVFRAVADHFPGALFAFDTCGRWVRDNSRKLEAVKLTGAEFLWGIDDVHAIEAWDPRYRVLEVDTVLNHHRHRFGWIVRLLTSLFPPLRRLTSVNLARLG